MLTSGCGKKEDSAQWWRSEQERLELSHQLELKEFRLAKLASGDVAELDRLRRSSKDLAVSRKSLEQRRLALHEETSDMSGRMEDFREATLRDRRNRAIGTTFDEFISQTGRTYRDVTIAAIDDAGVAIRHADGSARLRYEDLDGGQRLYFGLEGDLAVAAVARESESAAAYERWIDDQMAVVREREALAAAEVARREEQTAQANRIKLAARQSLASNTRPLAQPASSFSSGRSSSYSNYRVDRPFYRYVYYYPNYPASSYQNYGNPKSCMTYKQARVNRHVVPVETGKPKSFANTTVPYIP